MPKKTGLYLNCLYCDKENYVPLWKLKIGQGKYCNSDHYWKNKHDIPWNKGKKLTSEQISKLNLIGLEKGRGLYKGKHIQLNTGRTHFKKNHSSWNKGKKFPQFSGENHPAWKGDEVGYFALHAWVYRLKGKPKDCEFCGSIENLQWANKSGDYLRKVDDWLSLCVQCHKNYDKKMNKKAIYKYPYL